ncbi:MAG TPA: ATP-binding protein [Terriglobia bacterium]|nr:ATP-binding protein [Terriglobia bacterium]
MTSGDSIQIPRAWTPYLWWAFVTIIVGLVVSGTLSIYEMRNTQTKVELIEDRALASIQLAFNLSHDIDQWRRLFEDHIVESDSAGMKRIEGELANAEARMAATSRAYEPTITDDVERDAWQKLQAEIAAVQPKAASVIDLSRKNLDAQARAVMKTLQPDFDAIDQEMEGLVRLNRVRADQEVTLIRSLHRTAVIILAILTVALTGFVLLVAASVTRLIRQRESQMREATTLLQQRNEELDAFAGRVAHDLRGPLTAINLAAFAKEGTAEEGARAVFRRGVSQMETIIQDLLTLSRISAQTTEGRCQTARVAASAEEDLRPEVEGVGGVLRIEAADATVPCSAGLLRQVIWNLGENAVKYRRSGVQLEVEIRGRITKRTYEFSVSDNGMGMSPSEVQHAFEPFFRGEQVRSTPGTGLGLSIVKRVVEATGGSVSLESVPAQGTTFKIRLPLAASKAA